MFLHGCFPLVHVEPGASTWSLSTVIPRHRGKCENASCQFTGESRPHRPVFIYYAMVTDMILHVFTDHMDCIGRIVDTCKNFTRIDALICCILHSVRTISTRVIGTEAVCYGSLLLLFLQIPFQKDYKI